MRSPVESCSTEASCKHVMNGKNGTAKHTMPAPSSTPVTSHLSRNGAPLPLSTDTDYSTNFSFASLDPPITQALLSEIDLPRITNDLVFRHHLNFSQNTEYRINTQGPQAEKRQQREGEYWHAMATEIAFWLAHCQSIAACPSSPQSRSLLHWSGARNIPPGMALRLPRLFRAVRDMLKHLLPSKEWPAIDARLNVRFLMQQLEHGVCNFTVLGDWLGKFLRRFCSPTRYFLLHIMPSAIRLGVEKSDKDRIVHGLKTIFELLQGMNLVSWQ